MGRKTLGSTRRAKPPKRITEIGMTPDKYYKLKVYIKSVVVPGTPAFDFKRLGNGAGNPTYSAWLQKTLEEMGPRFFPNGAKGLVWPEDHNQIYKTVHQVVRALSIRIRKNYKKRELRAAKREIGSEEVKMKQDGEPHEGTVSGDTDVGEDVVALNEDERYAQWEQEEEKMRAILEAADQENQDDDTVEEGMDAEPIELEDLLGLMQPEVFANFPNLDDEYFDWDEILDPSSPEPIARLLLLLS
ncbi:unnamed protein product [Tuber aestivum]|uniref:Uncharacterized protein n=1 Tax=Tuber aestivum TaxID=59557 RepID=A0A292Q1Y9_9PEZI|nr:unnamed protein product [Tuber aestivum]